MANPVKATIINIDKDSRGASPIKCMFNPKEYTFAKTNTWGQSLQDGTNVPHTSFSSGAPATLTLELFFDTYGKSTSGQPQDVRTTYTNRITALMLVDKSLHDYAPENGQGRPPRVRFQWGNSWSFVAVIASVTCKFTMFMPDGMPVRATLNVTFQQVEDESEWKKQNPTSGGVGGERVWTVSDGDTLSWIAYKEYGDATQWRRIADANRMTRVRRLTPGMQLVVPNE